MAPFEIGEKDYGGMSARLAAQLLGEAFMDMALALEKAAPGKGASFITSLEHEGVRRLKEYIAMFDSPASATMVARDAAAFVREITQEAKNRISAASRGD